MQIAFYGTPENGVSYKDGLRMATEVILSLISITLLPLIRHLEGDINHINMEVMK